MNAHEAPTKTPMFGFPRTKHGGLAPRAAFIFPAKLLVAETSPDALSKCATIITLRPLFSQSLGEGGGSPIDRG